MFSGRLSIRPSVVCPLTSISRDAVSLYLVERETCHKYSSYEWELLYRFSRSKTQRSRSCVWNCEWHYGGGIHYDSVASSLTCLLFILLLLRV